jgi:cytochrome c oxidase subunit 2
MKTVRVALVGCAAVLAVSACGGGDSGPELSPAAKAGRDIASAVGCLACHGSAGQGGVGPAWKGLAGATVELEDGMSVVADRAYLERSIVQPGADITRGYTIVMPVFDLTSDEVASIVTYIQELR